MPKSRIRNRMKEYRERREMIQLTLSRLADITPSAVSEIEAGIREPGLFTALKMARALETTVDDLFELKKEGEVR